MDFTTVKTWSELNVLINEYFSDLDFQGNEENPFGIMYWITGLVSGGRINWSGSIPENTFMHPVIRNGAEADVLETVHHIPYEIHEHIFEEVPDEPGYVRIVYEETIGLLGDKLEVKEIKQVNGVNSAFYIVPNFDSMLFQNSAPASVKPSKNVLVQSLFDTFHVDEFIGGCQVAGHGPVATGETGDCAPLFKDFEEVVTNPKKSLFKFLGNLGSRVFENVASKTDGEKAQHDNNDQIPFRSEGNKLKNDPKKLTERKPTDPSLKILMDICPAIKCNGWPKNAEEFFSRQRVWPDETLLKNIKDEGFHLVYKPLDPHSTKSVEWRISFSNAEYILLRNMDSFRIKCYRILKTIYYSKLTMPSILCSYHLKNIFLWACERIPSEFWVEHNLAQIIMGLLDDLLDCLATKVCRHFFIPENNLFAHVHGDFLDRMAGLVSKIRRHPERLSITTNEIANLLLSDDADCSKQESTFEIELD